MTEKCILILASVFCASIVLAQENKTGIKEYGIGLRNLNGFSLQYRWGSESKLNRIGAEFSGSSSYGKTGQNGSRIDTARHSFDFNTNNTENKTPLIFYINVNYSILNLKFAAEKFGYFYGPSIGFGFNYSKDNNSGSQTSGNANMVNTQNIKSENSYTSYRPALGLVIGLVYKINANLLIYGELNPNIYYSHSVSTSHYVSGQTLISTNDAKRTLNTFGFSDLSNSGAMLTLVYRIGTN
jgi:hypothetical protein